MNGFQRRNRIEDINILKSVTLQIEQIKETQKWLVTNTFKSEKLFNQVTDNLSHFVNLIGEDSNSNKEGNLLIDNSVANERTIATASEVGDKTYETDLAMTPV